MAKARSKRRSMKGYIKGNVNEVLDLGTLAANTVVSTNFDESPQERALISSIVATYSLDLLTPGQGPIAFGVAHSDYTAAEIQAVFDSTGTWDTGDKISQEISKRLIRQIGVFVSDAGGTAVQDVKFNQGRPVKTKLNWMLNTNETLQLWAFNTSASALATTAPVIRVDGHANLWQR